MKVAATVVAMSRCVAAFCIDMTGSLACSSSTAPSRVSSVWIGATAVSEGLDREIVRRYVRRNFPRMQYCYEKQLQVNPELKGSLKADWAIGPEGTFASRVNDITGLPRAAGRARRARRSGWTRSR